MTRDILRLTIPGDPVPKARPRMGRGGIVYTPTKTKTAEQAIAWAVKAAYGAKEPHSGPVMAILTYRMRVPTSWNKVAKNAAIGGQILPTGKPDVDNLAKLTLDAIVEAGVIPDDAIITSLTVSKQYGSEPSTTIILQEDASQ